MNIRQSYTTARGSALRNRIRLSYALDAPLIKEGLGRIKNTCEGRKTGLNERAPKKCFRLISFCTCGKEFVYDFRCLVRAGDIYGLYSGRYYNRVISAGI